VIHFLQHFWVKKPNDFRHFWGHFKKITASVPGLTVDSDCRDLAIAKSHWPGLSWFGDNRETRADHHLLRFNRALGKETLFLKSYHLQGCQMVCIQTKNPNLGKFWRVLQWKMLVYSTYFHSVVFTADC
jgi:hypothetical protein